MECKGGLQEPGPPVVLPLQCKGGLQKFLVCSVVVPLDVFQSFMKGITAQIHSVLVAIHNI
jgi:hypothetical protein